MQIATEANVPELAGELAQPFVQRASWAWAAVASSAGVLWGWAAFVRGGSHDRRAQLLLTAAIAALAVLLWLARSVILRRVGAAPGASFAFSASSFLLLAVFLPDYLLGKPQALPRSLVLLTLFLLLFAAYSALPLRPDMSRLGWRAKPKTILLGFCVVYFGVTTWVTLVKLRAFGYVGQDIAYFSQCLYTTLHGQLFSSNLYHDLLYGKPVGSDLAGHNQLVLLVFLPFYFLHKSASTILVVRNVFIVLCAWPVYLTGRRISPWVGAMAAMAFLLLPAVLYQNFYDFAPLSLAGLPLLFALYYFLESRFGPFLVALVCAQMVREDLVFAVFGFGLLALGQRRRLRWIAFPCAFAILWAVFSWKILFPHFLHGATPAVAGCFSYLGNTPGEIIGNILRHPRMLLSHENLLYIKQMGDPFGQMLFLLNPAWLISVPYIAINLAGEGGGCNTAMIYRHYSLIPSVFLFGSVLLALPKIATWARRKGLGSAAPATLMSFVLAAAVGSIAMVTGQQQWEELRVRPWHQEARRIAATLPPGAPVAVPRYLLPAVANRMSLYQSLRLLEYHHPDARFIVIDKDWKRMAATDQWRENYEALRRQLAVTPEYSVIYDSPGYVIFKLCDGCAPHLPHRDPIKETRD